MIESRDFVVIGGGIIGIQISRELKVLHPDCSVAVLEKEKRCGLHASGRNSGVIHAGFYYFPDSLKAQLARSGNKALTRYCEDKNIPLNRCGKLVVAQGPEDILALEELMRRGKANGVPLWMLSSKEAQEIEPRVLTYEKALFSPTTSTVDPFQVMESLRQDAISEGVDIRENEAYLSVGPNGVRTSAGVIKAGYVVNAAGLYADKIARDFGFSQRHRIVPFKGLYLNSTEPVGSVRTNVYPVPDIRNPFLGVHFTLAANGNVHIGPTAIPAFWREQYAGLEGFSLKEMLEITARNIGLLFYSDFDFKRLALEEFQKYSAQRMAALAGRLLKGVRPENFRKWGLPGMRAQLLNIETMKLEMDFVVEGDNRSLHVLNAVSPGFTCAIPFAEHVCDKIKDLY